MKLLIARKLAKVYYNHTPANIFERMVIMTYWYIARIIIERDSQKVVFKSDFPDYVPGDQIVKRYKMGVLVRLRIIKSYGQEIPVDTLKALQDRQIFPFIISEI